MRMQIVKYVVLVIVLCITSVSLYSGFMAYNTFKELEVIQGFGTSVECTVRYLSENKVCTCLPKNGIHNMLYRKYIMKPSDKEREEKLKKIYEERWGKKVNSTGCEAGVYSLRKCPMKIGVQCGSGGPEFLLPSGIIYPSSKDEYFLNARLPFYTDTATKSLLMAEQPFKLKHVMYMTIIWGGVSTVLSLLGIIISIILSLMLKA